MSSVEARRESSAPLFGRERRLLGWQGFSFHVPEGWNPGKFGGKHKSGDLRVDDENGVRLELRWETPRGTPNVERSVELFVKRLEKEAKRRKEAFSALPDAKVVSKSRKKKEQITNFGWESDGKSGAPCGFGTAWYCPVCERVTFAHVVGQRGETAKRAERLASDVLNDLECHGEGGWETWSAFDTQIDVPKEFELSRAQMRLNKMEWEWVRPRPVGLWGWGRRPERLQLSRFPVANVLLTNKTLRDWADFNIREKNKILGLREPEETEWRGFEALRYPAVVKNLPSRFSVAVFDRLLRRRTPAPEILVWHDTDANRIFAWETEVSHVNTHVPKDALNSLVSR